MPRFDRFADGAAGALVMTLLLEAPILGVQAHPEPAAPREIRHIPNIDPTSGPPGTRVSVSTFNLPLEARVHVGIGAMRDGFEALTETLQGEWGEIAVEVEVPHTTSWERPIVFVAFNAVFAPIGLSDPFHVTNEEGLIRRRGQVLAEQEACPTFRDQDDYLYELMGVTERLEPGVPLRVDGVYLEAGPCSDGPAIRVSAVEHAVSGAP